MKFQNKDLTVIQSVEALIDGVGKVDFGGKCNHWRVEEGWVLFEAVHRTDPSKYLYLEAYREEDVRKITWKYGKDEINKYFIGDAAMPSVDVAEPEDAVEAEKKEEKRERKPRK